MKDKMDSVLELLTNGFSHNDVSLLKNIANECEHSDFTIVQNDNDGSYDIGVVFADTSFRYQLTIASNFSEVTLYEINYNRFNVSRTWVETYMIPEEYRENNIDNNLREAVEQWITVNLVHDMKKTISHHIVSFLMSQVAFTLVSQKQ